ncbi:MAG: RagB/SusD family nutrient uptake outer membrane protein [Williamsia sp.]|nr:RagB/SusD family nutrient uptake outer membrane protein [Williamsia sp.]
MINIKFSKRIAFVAVLFTAFSCNKYLDDNVNKSTVTEETQWASEVTADIFLNAVYQQLSNMNNTPDYLDDFTDDNDGGIYWRSWRWKQGIVGPSNDGGLPMGETNQGPHGNYADWSAAYSKIRRCNVFIQKVTENKAGTFTAAWSAKRIDEAKFLRAYWYAMLWQHVGGLPVITKVLSNTDGSEIYYARNTFEETFNFIVSELDTVINNNKLAVKYNAGNADAGRATLGAALMLKGWVQLYGASPLFNSGTYPLSDPGNLVHFATASSARWATAAATFKKFMDSYTQYSLFAEQDKLWYTANEYNSEVIWDRQNVATAIPNNIDQFGGPVYILGSYHTWGNYNPTQELVDDFRMANGKRISDPTSGYDPQKPYVGRENRFYQFVVFDGATYKQDWMPRADIIYTRINKVKKEDNEIDFATGDVSNTAYYFKKKLNNLAPEGGSQNGTNYIYYRFAEVLLGYAEAQNEAVGPDASVYAAVNKIRQRTSTNLPALEPGLTQAQMRQEIRDQRRIELCFEAKRFYDIIRWKIAKDVMNVDLHGMKITNTVPADNSGVWKYEPVGLNHPHVFTDKMYMNPVPQSVIDNNSKLKTQQNPGY